LLRELGADINGIVERSLVSSNISNEVSKTQHDDCHPDVGTSPDLLFSLKRSHVTGKRSRCELKNKKLNCRSGSKYLELACSRASDVKNDTTLVQGSSTNHNGLEDEDGAHNQMDVSPSLPIMPSAGNTSNCIASQNGLLLNSIGVSEDKRGGAVPLERQTGFLSSANKKTTEITENLSAEKLVKHALLIFHRILFIGNTLVRKYNLLFFF
jgi:hypothetical protein